MATTDNLPPPPAHVERHKLVPESELRLEIPFNASCSVTLRSGSAEVFGAELATDKPYVLSGTKTAVFTWHGCVVDVDESASSSSSSAGAGPGEAAAGTPAAAAASSSGGGGGDIFAYPSEETDANVAYVNTHAQLEAMRDGALAVATASAADAAAGGGGGSTAGPGGGTSGGTNADATAAAAAEGPRVLLAGPADCGKSSLARVLMAYAVKLGRTPILVDLDPSQNMLSVPGTLSASPITADSVSVATHASGAGSIAGGTTPLVLWYGSTDPGSNVDLYKAQLDKLGTAIDARLSGDVDARASGFVVNTTGWIEDLGYKLLLHAIDALRINVVLILGHDRLYSMITTHFKKKAAASASTEETDKRRKASQPKVIKLPRSGGVVSRDAKFRRSSRSACIKKYFNGDLVRSTDGSAAVSQYTPSLLELPFDQLRLFKLSSVSLAASMLPVAAKQSTDPVQLTPVEIGPTLKHAVLAVCHPAAVESYERSGENADLYLSGVAGFIVVEKVNMDRDIVSLLSPCAGSLPSTTLLVGDVTWME